MTLMIRHAPAAQTLFDAYSANLDDKSAAFWFTHRLHRDLLLQHASESGIAGWLKPPFAFFSELPARFGIKAKPISLLDRRDLVNHLALQKARTHGINLPAAGASITRSSMLDSFFSEILPEGATPSVLREQLTHAAADDFARRRNEWIVSVYDAYLAELASRGLADPRQVHALIADRIESGELRSALGGKEQLHIYGLYSARTRRRLLSTLAAQSDIGVTVYTTTGALDEFRPFAGAIDEITGGAPVVRVQPAPDAWREAEWVAGEVKKRIVHDGMAPHDIAVVARTGAEDTRRTLQVLRNAGIPATARVRAPLAEISAVKAILVLFRAAAEEWSYPNLRRVITTPYFKTRVDVRTIDRIAREARPYSLAAWLDELHKLIARETVEAAAQTNDEYRVAQERRIERYAAAVEPLEAAIVILQRLDGDRDVTQWIELTRELLRDGWFDFRRRVCRPPEARSDVVRFDQRAIRQLESMLRQWGEVAEAGEEMSPAAWYALFRTLLAGQELALTSPGQKGVQILEAHDAALVPFRAVYLTHANDGVFPRLPAPGGLFAEEERVALANAGLAVDTYGNALQRETALWHATTSAHDITLTYRTTDPKGTPLLASLLVPEHDENNELPRSADLATEPLNAQQESYEAACRLGDDVRAGGSPARIITPDPAAMRHLILQAHAEQMRGAPARSTVENPLNPWNGQLRDPVVLEWLAQRYGVEHKWSASQLETYGQNPFFYLIKRVLRLEEMEEADEETNALTSGGVAHDILELFFRELELPTTKDRATAVFIEAARTVFERREQSGEWLGLGLFWEQRKYWLCETLIAFIQYEVEKNDPRPKWCEYELGGETGIATLNSHDLVGNKVSMRLRGRIDRVDDLDGQYMVIDYKSGQTPGGKTGFCDGAVLQGMIYIEALKQEGLNATSSLYRSIKNRGSTKPLFYEEPAYTTARAIAFSIPARIRAGLFEANLAASQSWAEWSPDLGIVRNRAQLEKGATRF